jgi:uncharacterized membrane protein YphA (DoxX/SURF4 family)
VASPEPRRPESPPPTWHPATRFAFRFAFVYFGLYVLTAPGLGWTFRLPWHLPSLAGTSPVERLVTAVATGPLGFEAPLEMIVASGDRPYDWAHLLLLLVVGLVAAGAWSLLDRRRREYRTLHGWFLIGLRITLGAVMVTYGAVKLVPLQMPYPDLARLVQPFGSFSPMGVLWTSMGAAPAYQTFTGALELLAGILLFVPRLAVLGALLALGMSTQVFALNMAYDVPVKLFSFHLMVMALVILAPELRRLAAVLVLERGVEAPDRPPLLASRRGRQVLLGAQLALGAWVVIGHVGSNVRMWLDRPEWLETRAGQPDSPFYGIWDVESKWIEDEPRPALLTDEERWRRVIFQGSTFAAVQFMNDRVARLPASVDEEAGTVALGPRDFEASFAFERPDPDRMLLDGEVDGRPVRMELRRMAREDFLLLQTRFRWVQDLPFNR